MGNTIQATTASLTASTAGAQALQNTRRVGSDTEPSLTPTLVQSLKVGSYRQTLPPDVAADVVAKALATRPELYNQTIENFARRSGIPVEQTATAFERTAQRAGVKLTEEDGTPRTVQAILKDLSTQLPAAELKDALSKLPRDVRNALTAAAVAGVLASKGLAGLGDLGLKATLLKGNDGSLTVSLGRNGNALVGKAAGEIRIPLGKDVNLKAEGSVDTAGQATGALTGEARLLPQLSTSIKFDPFATGDRLTGSVIFQPSANSSIQFDFPKLGVDAALDVPIGSQLNLNVAGQLGDTSQLTLGVKGSF
jgi:hypothetical protein